MSVILIIVSGILGTMVMTIFSHILEKLSDHKFNETHLLNRLINRSKTFDTVAEDNDFRGWAIHLVIGILMAAGLFFYLNHAKELNPLLCGLVLGFFLGIIGVLGWTVMFLKHSDPPEINLTYFFIQLICAHMIFGITALWILTKLT
ncbi:DUF6789 family protein [Maribacter sp. LLG6340-A2]|uniref:DUF6789 family protein n=1 Tax=Maribacter sp. LLG6340-A2 TaxID=3160834 RepID=UPI00386E7DF1